MIFFNFFYRLYFFYLFLGSKNYEISTSIWTCKGVIYFLSIIYLLVTQIQRPEPRLGSHHQSTIDLALLEITLDVIFTEIPRSGNLASATPSMLTSPDGLRPVSQASEDSVISIMLDDDDEIADILLYIDVRVKNLY